LCLAHKSGFLKEKKSNLLLNLNIITDYCAHLQRVDQNIKAKTPNGCEECLQMGSDWVYLRLCLSCGHVGCCDSSPNKHGNMDFKSTDHPVIKSYEPGEDLKWCYVDQRFMK
jgi:uncharacterized UBP type Zn finger protein